MRLELNDEQVKILVCITDHIEQKKLQEDLTNFHGLTLTDEEVFVDVNDIREKLLGNGKEPSLAQKVINLRACQLWSRSRAK
jgi:hypothetical protein